jgi:hypothetical protein
VNSARGAIHGPRGLAAGEAAPAGLGLQPSLAEAAELAAAASHDGSPAAETGAVSCPAAP